VANTFAEVCAAVVLAGEPSLTDPILHGDWPSSHEQLGRNRPEPDHQREGMR
jgi:hydroxymethylglutaryl-CoA reductase (NADPH)